MEQKQAWSERTRDVAWTHPVFFTDRLRRLGWGSWGFWGSGSAKQGMEGVEGRSPVARGYAVDAQGRGRRLRGTGREESKL